MSSLVLSLFPGIGILDRAFEAEGFCVVRGPDVLWGGDIRRFNPPPGRFDGVIGGPPCQAFSRLSAITRAKGLKPRFGNLIPEFERVVSEARPIWFVMENVPDAPTPTVPGYATWSCLLNNRQCFAEDGKPATQNRVRRWTFGDSRTGQRTPLLIDTAVFANPVYDYAALGGSTGSSLGASGWDGYKKSDGSKSRLPFNAKTARTFTELCRLQGLPDNFDLPGFTVAEKCRAVGNGVPLPMGRAIARAVSEAIGDQSGNHAG